MKINLPYYWTVIKSLNSVETDVWNLYIPIIESVFNDILTLYSIIKFPNTDIYRNIKLNILVFKWLDKEKYSNLSSLDIQYLKDNNFVLYNETSNEFYKENFRFINITNMVDSLEDSSIVLTNNYEFYINNETLYFTVDLSNYGFYYRTNTLVLPSGTTIAYKYVILLGVNNISNVEFLYNFIGNLVNDAEFTNNVYTQEQYKQLIFGLWVLMNRGMTYDNLNTACNVIFGLPIILHDEETILSITSTQIITDKNEYPRYTLLDLNDTIVEGNTVKKFTPIYNVIEIMEHEDIAPFIIQNPHLYYTMTSDMNYRQFPANPDNLIEPTYENLEDYKFFFDMPNKYFFSDYFKFRKIRQPLYYIWKTFFDNSVVYVKINFTYNLTGVTTDAFMKILEVLPIHVHLSFIAELTLSDTIDDIDDEYNFTEEGSHSWENITNEDSNFSDIIYIANVDQYDLEQNIYNSIALTNSDLRNPTTTVFNEISNLDNVYDVTPIKLKVQPIYENCLIYKYENNINNNRIKLSKSLRDIITIILNKEMTDNGEYKIEFYNNESGTAIYSFSATFGNTSIDIDFRDQNGNVFYSKSLPYTNEPGQLVFEIVNTIEIQQGKITFFSNNNHIVDTDFTFPVLFSNIINFVEFQPDLEVEGIKTELIGKWL